MVGANISEVENNYNREEAAKAGLGEDCFRVDHASFDDVQYPNESFDVVMTQEAILHSADKEKAMNEFCRILKKGGMILMSDIIEAPDADRSKL